MIATFILVVGQSRLLLAIQAGKSISDNLVATYAAESEIINIIGNLARGTWDTSDLASIPRSRNIADVEIITEIDNSAEQQIIDITARRTFSVQKIQAVRNVRTFLDGVEIVMALDCTSSMNDSASGTGGGPTRFDALKSATLTFINKMEQLELDNPEEFGGKFKFGILTYGIDAKWAQFNGDDLTPQNPISYDQLRTLVQTGFGSTRQTSSLCANVMDATSIGSGLAKMHEYFDSHIDSRKKSIEILITDGLPNSRIPDNSCPPLNNDCPSWFPSCTPTSGFCPGYYIEPGTRRNYCESNEYGWSCDNYDYYSWPGHIDGSGYNSVAYDYCSPKALNYLRCTLAKSNTNVSEIGQTGSRNPNVDAYTVTVLQDDPSSAPTINAFRKYADLYLNASQADQLTDRLNTVFDDIVSKLSVTTITRVIPQPE